MSIVPPSLSLFIEIVEGFHTAKLVYAASVLILGYDFALCIDREIDFFWRTGSNRLTKSLYYLNRLCPLISFCFRGVTLFHYGMSDGLCRLWTRFDFAWTILALYLAEVVLVVRVYNLYSYSRMAQWLILIFSLVGGLVALALMIAKLSQITVTKNIPLLIHQHTAGCLPDIPGEFWSVFVPIFISETLLFLLTLYRVRESLIRGGSSHPLVKCLIMDGTAFYLAVLASAGVSLGGSVVKSYPQFSLGALLSNSIVAACSIAACRLILSIRSLASRLKYDPDAIFNHLELARIYGNGVGKVRKSGEFGSRIIIEIGNGEIELEDMGRDDKHLSDNYALTTEESGNAMIVADPFQNMGPWRPQSSGTH